MTEEEKARRLERIAFNKHWGKIRKLCATVKDVKRNVGKAPACNTNPVKKETVVQTSKKKR